MRQLIFFFMCVPLLAPAQTSNGRLVDSLKYVTDMPYICESDTPYGIGCGSNAFWKAVQQKETIIPFLVDKLADTTMTKAYVPNFEVDMPLETSRILR